MYRSLRRTVPVLVVALSLSALAAACTPAGPARTTTVASVDVARYAGTWYEVASVKQFFSLGLVDTKAEYSLLPDGSIKVVNTGRYFTKDGLLSTITGTAVPVDASNAILNVSFTGSKEKLPLLALITMTCRSDGLVGLPLPPPQLTRAAVTDVRESMRTTPRIVMTTPP